jgi:hypothetical protein
MSLSLAGAKTRTAPAVWTKLVKVAASVRTAVIAKGVGSPLSWTDTGSPVVE